MTPFDYYLEGFRRYFDFDGRSSRSEYWYFVLVHLLVSLTLLSMIFLSPKSGLASYILYSFAIAIPNFALIIRRLHDTNRSGVCVLFSLIPLAGPIIMLLFLTEEGTHGPNKYGADPIEYIGEESYL